MDAIEPPPNSASRILQSGGRPHMDRHAATRRATATELYFAITCRQERSDLRRYSSPSSAACSCFGPLSRPFNAGSRSTSSITAMLAASP
jgi:hypothetical protein